MIRLLFLVFGLLGPGLLLAQTSAEPGRSGLHLASVNAAVAYAGDDELLVGKNAHHRVPIASLTKLMTALVVLDSKAPLNEWLEFYPRHKPAAANAYSRIRKHSQLKRGDMLRIAIMSSENFAAYTLARHFAGGYDAFVEAMNARARSLGMTDTHYVDPTGLSSANQSTAADLVKLVNAVYQYPEMREYSTTEYYRAHFREPRYSLSFGNTNPLVHRESWGVRLSKTGYLNEAGRCLVMISEMQGKAVTTVLLDSFGSRSAIGDAGRIRRWLDTGQSGRVAGAAKRYEQRRNAQFAANGPDQGIATQ